MIRSGPILEGYDMTVSRRELLAGAAATSAVVAAGGLGGARADAAPAHHPHEHEHEHEHEHKLPKPKHSGLDHIVFMCMENRSFDHFLGWVPGARGRQRGLSYPDDAGVLHPTHHLQDWTGLGFHDPDHSYTGGRVQLDGGKLDGFRKGRNDDYALGFYGRRDLATMSQLVRHFTVCDNWFASILGPTFPNRFYTHSAATDRITNTFDACNLPTIWDRLAAAHIPARYYASDAPVLALYGNDAFGVSKYASITHNIQQFYDDAAAGTLPSYSYVDPSFFGPTQNDDHPHADIRRGQALIGRVVNAILQSPQWANTALVITYDEWGGFFDHVRPPRFPDEVDNPGGDTNNPDHGQAGFRVPSFLISPFARRGHVDHTTFEHSAILKLVEWRFGLEPLTKRDRASNNLANSLDFRRPNHRPPRFVVPPEPAVPARTPAQVQSTRSHESAWREVAAMDRTAAQR